jgi:poly(3-hydroxybutyrate) depolymerase
MVSKLFIILLVHTTGLTAGFPTLTAGCGKALPSTISPGQSQAFSLVSQRRSRQYIIHIPSNYNVDTPAPIIFSYHGRNRNSTNQEQLSEFDRTDYNPDAIAIYPQGIKNQWQGDPAAPADISDLQFTSDLLDHFEERYCIDRSKVYAAGKSNGGGFVGGVLACNATLSNRFAAFAPVSGAFYENQPPCAPGRTPIPIMEFHGSADQTIPYNGGQRRRETLPPIEEWLGDWATRNGCANGTTPTLSELFDGNVEKRTWTCDCSEDIVTGYKISGLGHAWPATHPNPDNNGTTFLDATPIIMQFFNAHTLPLGLLARLSLMSSSIDFNLAATARTPSLLSSNR